MYNRHMSDKAKAAQQARWRGVGVEERMRLGKIHSKKMKEWWASLSVEEKTRRGFNAATKKHAKTQKKIEKV